MIRENIDNLEAGRDLDALIAKNVFGHPLLSQEQMRAIAEADWQRNPRQQYFDGFKAVPRDAEAAKLPFSHDLAAFEADCPHYSTDLSSAWAVVEKLCKDSGGFRLGLHESVWWCYWGHPEPPDAYSYVGNADTAPLAICRAALKAVTKL